MARRGKRLQRMTRQGNKATHASGFIAMASLYSLTISVRISSAGGDFRDSCCSILLWTCANPSRVWYMMSGLGFAMVSPAAAAAAGPSAAAVTVGNGLPPFEAAAALPPLAAGALPPFSGSGVMLPRFGEAVLALPGLLLPIAGSGDVFRLFAFSTLLLGGLLA